MPQVQLTGSRIRERRILKGMRQADLARQAGISASYLNLIEHNRRRIGGKLLLNLAQVLGVEPSLLSEGAEAAIIATLGEAHAADPEAVVGQDTSQDFAGRFPGWAELLARRHRRVLELEHTVETLSDRLTHDPHLAAALHEVLSTVTAIRSTAGILADTPELEPEWRDRFHRNINEDSARLTDSAQALVSYLDAGAEEDAGLTSPQEELEAFLGSSSFHFGALETGHSPEDLPPISQSDILQSGAGQALAHSYLETYQQDAQAMPLADVLTQVKESGPDPAKLAQRFGVSVARAMRRLATLPEGEGLPDIGLVSSDASGTLIFRKAIEGFALPRYGAACPKWPLFQALSRPMVPLRRVIEQDSRSGLQFEAYAIAEPSTEPTFDQAPLFQAHMMVVALPAGSRRDETPAFLGVGCRICPRESCNGRREPSILTDGL
ncbi:MAG: helix-turn-helix domain-containing protein [Thalassovita sp.]